MPDQNTGLIRVEVVYALSEKQALLSLEVPEGTTLKEAIEASEIRAAFPDIVIDPGRLGIFGQRADGDRVLKAGDRVEIYRPLVADPKETRRARALKKAAEDEKNKR
jgi:putative ubiquitin-RnfH superfamily antitoxin RatB of RatAB toxin-antitoxin module